MIARPRRAAAERRRIAELRRLRELRRLLRQVMEHGKILLLTDEGVTARLIELAGARGVE